MVRPQHFHHAPRHARGVIYYFHIRARGLGYIGLLVSGSYHQMHHLAMAKGEFDHEHLGHTH
jgi:hypothetical protein